MHKVEIDTSVRAISLYGSRLSRYRAVRYFQDAGHLGLQLRWSLEEAVSGIFQPEYFSVERQHDNLQPDSI